MGYGLWDIEGMMGGLGGCVGYIWGEDMYDVGCEIDVVG